MSTISIGQMNQLGNALEAAGWSETHVTKLGQCGRLAEVLAFLEGKAEIVMKKVEEAVVTFLALIKTITAPAVAGKKTTACFTDKSRYYHRDSDLDGWLPENQQDQPEGNFSVQRLGQNATFKQAVESFLGQTGDVKTLSRLLKERGAVTTLPAIESLIERQENGEDVSLRTDGWANFFFVKNKNEENDEEGSVSVVDAYRDVGRWSVRVRRLGHVRVWGPESRFFFRNKTL